jgi:hypothetical protein
LTGGFFCRSFLQLIGRIDVLEEVLPDLVDGLLQRLAPVRQGDDAHDLREVGVTGVPDQQTVDVVADFLGVGSVAIRRRETAGPPMALWPAARRRNPGHAARLLVSSSLISLVVERTCRVNE